MGPPKTDPMQWPKPLAVMTLIGFIYFVFLYNNILPQIQRLTFGGHPGVLGARHTDPFFVPKEFHEVLAITISFHVCFLFLIITFVRSVLTPPGTVPRTEKWRMTTDTEKEGPLLQRLKDILAFPIRVRESKQSLRLFMQSVAVADRTAVLKEKRVCKKCNVFKPDRCHHCSQCGTCVLRMDHHCTYVVFYIHIYIYIYLYALFFFQNVNERANNETFTTNTLGPFISNCVGFNNHKYFLQLLFYSNVCLLFVLVDMFPRFRHIFRFRERQRVPDLERDRARS